MTNANLERRLETGGKSIIWAADLCKDYGSLRAVDKLNLDIPEGQFFGLLGPNGSGKTTTIHMLTTLARPTHGRAQVAGRDVLKESVAVRREIGLVFQESALDRTLTVDENLRFAGMLRNLPTAILRQRSEELLDLFRLRERHDKPVATLSGGMRRALDIARSVLHRPRILFLDEPTLGLDVPNRRKIIGSGAPKALVQSFGTYIIEIESEQLDAVVAPLSRRFGPCLQDDYRASFRTHDEHFNFMDLQAELGARVDSVRWRRPNLNDVFMWVNEPTLSGSLTA
jgi:ABC-2 type transport system ATP-binding protein